MSIAKKMTGVLLAASLCSFAGPVSHFGKLVACGANICGEKTGTSTPIQLKGPSLFWSTGDPAVLFDPITVEWFTVNFNIGVIRAPMAIKYYGENKEPISVSDGNQGVTSYGYLSTGSEYKGLTKNLIKKIVDAAIENDIYVIVDWHSHNAHSETSEAANFFKEMATEYKDVPNLIWEIYNEPVSASASQINEYAKTVAAAIRGAGNENLIVVGTNFYSSKPNEQAQQGLHNTYKNIAYTLHFYAGADHNGYKSNLASNAPTFVTEWGASAADGGQNQSTVNDASGWRSWMDQNKLSGCMWFAGTNGNGQNGTTVQSSAMFPYGTNTTNLDGTLSKFSGTNTTAGVFAAYMGTNKWTSFVPSSHPMGNTIKASVAEGASKTFSSTDLGIRGTISEVTATVGTVTKTDNSITFQTPEYGSPEKIAISYSVTSGDITTKERIIVSITDRKPILRDTTIAVSYKNPTKFTLAKLGAGNPLTKGSVSGLSLVSAQVSGGTAVTSGDTIVFTPAGQGPVELTYSVKNSNGTATAKVTLLCQNMAPSIYAKANMGNKPNTDPVEITLTTMRANDADGDVVRFRVGYLDPNFTGTLTMSEDSTKLIYTPDGAHTGSVTILSVLTDGIVDSKIGSAVFKLTGSGSAINVTAPTTIPNYEPITAIRQLVAPVTMSSLKVTRSDIYLGLVQSGRVVVDLYSVKGKRVMSLVNQDLSAGMHSIGWNASSIPAGTYIVRMRQGSTVKTQWFVNR